MADIEYPITLSTTEPNNHIGVIKVRQADNQTQTLIVQNTANGQPKGFEGLTPFFCSYSDKAKGIGLIEQKVDTIIDAREGKFEYTFNHYDWQQVGLHKAYFAFKKQNCRGEWVKQFSTRDFDYYVTPNIYSSGIRELRSDGSTYLWTFEELLRRTEEYVQQEKEDWESFVVSNKSMLENVDPGGAILNKIDRLERVYNISAIESLKFNGEDETFELQELILANAGKTIVFPEDAELVISDTIVVPDSTTLRGGTTFSSVGCITMFDLKSNTKIDGLLFKGKDFFSYDEIALEISGKNDCGENCIIENVRIENCIFNGIGGMCISALRANTLSIVNCEMYNTGYAGVHCFSCEDVLVDKTTIDGILSGGSKDLGYNVTFSNNVSDIDIEANQPSKNCKVINCTIKNNPNWEGLDTHGGDNISFINNFVENCKRGIAVVSVGGASEIQNYPKKGSDNCTISGNTIIGNGLSQGIAIAGVTNSETMEQYARNINVTNNILVGCGETDNNLDGSIRVRDVLGINISDNQINESCTHGINIYLNVKEFTINNNVIQNPNSASVQTVGGIVLSTKPDGNNFNTGSIQNNQFLKTMTTLNNFVGQRAIYINGAEHVVTIGLNNSTFTEYIVGNTGNSYVLEKKIEELELNSAFESQKTDDSYFCKDAQGNLFMQVKIEFDPVQEGVVEVPYPYKGPKAGIISVNGSLAMQTHPQILRDFKKLTIASGTDGWKLFMTESPITQTPFNLILEAKCYSP